MKANIKMKLLAPLSHYGDEKMGTMQAARTYKYKYENDFIDVPSYSGNAFRGQLRRTLMFDYLVRIGIIDKLSDEEWANLNCKTEEETATKKGISAKLYYMLFSGGALTSGSRYNELGKKREMRKMCPPLSLLGTAIGDQIPEGKMKSAIFLPICKELADYTGIESDLSFYDMLQDVFYTRRDDLKSKDFNITDGSKHDNAVQMKYEMQCLSAGTILTGDIVIENSNSIEEGCFAAGIERFKECPYIGGKSAIGHGKVEILNDELPSSQLYYDYLKKNKEEMATWIREVESIL